MRAPSFPELIVEATRAFIGLVPESARGPLRESWHNFAVSGADRAATLVEWLNELVFLGEAEGWLPTDLEVVRDGESGVRIRAKEMVLEEPFVLVKAATLHQADVREMADGIEAEVTLDI